MMDPERFNHDSSAYERPNYKFRCGRAAAWGKPCPNGPGADGSCGGIAACALPRSAGVGGGFGHRRHHCIN